MTPSSTADAPKTIRPYNGVFIQETVTPSYRIPAEGSAGTSRRLLRQPQNLRSDVLKSRRQSRSLHVVIHPRGLPRLENRVAERILVARIVGYAGEPVGIERFPSGGRLVEPDHE